MSTVTVVPTVDASNVPPRIRLDVTDTGTPSIFATTVTRLNPDGSLSPVRTPDGNPLVLSSRGTRTKTDGVTTASSTTVTSATAAFTSNDVGATISGGSIPAGSTIVSITSATAVVISAAATATATSVSVTISGPNVGTVYDYEAAYAPVSYSTQESPATVSASVTIPETRVWLISPGVPSASMPIEVGTVSARVRTVHRGVYYPMGRKFPVVQTDGQRKAPEYTLTVLTQSLDELNGLLALCSDASVLLLNVPDSLGAGIGAEYVSIGDVSEGRPSPYAGNQFRSVELPITVVDRPAGGTQAARTLADLMVYPSLGALNSAYPTLLALQTGP